ncbi:MAG: orotidine-5'-phosphate decarboxylase, partial [Firmicutes bacterium]|nr:orotidine-5'-phosphate decarboxylase [Bacillota bacterium]
MMEAAKKIIIALDTASQEKALQLASLLKSQVDYFKVGLE